MNYSTVIVAAGKSTRFGGPLNKLLNRLSDGRVVLDATINVFLSDEKCKQIVIATNEDTLAFLKTMDYYDKLTCTDGGETRSDSVYNCLLKVKEDVVLVHDGARCYLLKQDLDILVKTLETEEAALLVKDETDTVKKVENGYIVESVDRSTLKRAQTPQGFRTQQLIEAYKLALKDNFKATDDAGIMEKYGNVRIKCVNSSGSNEKVTTILDIK